MTTHSPYPAVSDLRQQFAGSVLTPDDAGYDAARTIFNAMVDRRPAVIAQCTGTEDVRAALAFADRTGLEVAVRGGGHSVAGASLTEGGLVVDLRRMRSVTVDPHARTAVVEGGATWSDFDRACQPHGLGTTGGRVSSTGVAGLTLGGGSGWLERKFGLASDSLLAVDLVTADGIEIHASEDEHPDLFWALHGGGGNFGVATRLTFRLHPLPVTSLALLFWEAEQGPDVLAAYRDLVVRGVSEDLGGAVAYLTGPPEEFVPAALQGKRVVVCIGIYAGTAAELRDVLAPMLALKPDGELLTEMPYCDIQCALDDPPGLRNYWSAAHLSALPDEALRRFGEQGMTMLVPTASQSLLVPWGGAVAAGAQNWPQPHRSAAWVVHPFGLWEDAADDAAGISWARDAIAAMQPFATGAVYLNFIGDEGMDRVIAGYGRQNYTRLAAVKLEYDPRNVFHLHHNIHPAAAARRS
ncbi:FAD-binding oxidoreductase [Nocardia xishanensis]|uniref:FAD-binding oxidoreductase n=1 Tax=Nocardia xishanensis TaxID=238964 RepID=UPI0008300114|nr:FAD-binding oxidoreductase [Nocardia xishanensis]